MTAAAILLAADAAAMPDPNVVLTVCGVVIAAVVAFIGVFYTARSSSRANARTIAVTQRTADQAGMASLVSALQTEVARLTARVDLLEKDRREDRNALVAERALRVLAVQYAREVLTWALRAAPGHTPPTPPADLAREFPEPEGVP